MPSAWTGGGEVMTLSRNRRVLAGLVLALVILVITTLIRSGGSDDRTITATFQRTTSLYAGAQVKVLGVKVGRVSAIKVTGTTVKVTMKVSDKVDLPRDVHALIVPPSIVGDRFVQLAPAYRSGPKLEDHATLGLERTGVPLELDDTYAALDKLAVGLGPKGANKSGALSNLVTATARNLSGHGAAFNAAVREMAGAISTLAGSSGDIDATVDNIAGLTSTLAGKDAELRALVTNLAKVGAELNNQRTEVSGSVVDLHHALQLVADFVKSNRGKFRTSIHGAAAVSAVLAARSQELSRLLDLAPVGLTSLANIYIPTNWDPSKPWLTPVAGRTGSANLRGAFFDDLDSQLGFTIGAVCAELSPAQKVQLAAFCSTLSATGGNLGALLSRAIEQGGTGSTGALSLSGLLGGPR